MFVVLEGGEGGGKSTQIKRLAHELYKRGYKVRITREPGGTEIGEELRDYVLHRELNDTAQLILFMAARVIHAERIKSWLNEGYTVLCDRWFGSTYVYQGLSLNNNLIQNLQAGAIGDLGERTILLDVSPEIGLARKNLGERNVFEAKDLLYHNAIRGRFLNAANKFMWDVINVDGKTEQQITEEILDYLGVKHD